MSDVFGWIIKFCDGSNVHYVELPLSTETDAKAVFENLTSGPYVVTPGRWVDPCIYRTPNPTGKRNAQPKGA